MGTPFRRRCLHICHFRRLKRCTAVETAVFLIITYVIIVMNTDISESSEKYSSAAGYYSSLVEAIAARASHDRYIVLAMVDEGFTDMAMNFREASLSRHHIDNYLFVAVGNSTCDALNGRSVACFRYVDDRSAAEASEFGETDFIRKMNIRTEMILEALAANFTVIHTDLDVSFLANPLHEIKAVMETADVAALWNSRNYNAGFIIVKPTNISKQLYQTIKSLTDKFPTVDDQLALNIAVESLRRLKLTVLNRQRFLSGFDYFEKQKRLLPISSDNTACKQKNQHQSNCAVVVHNNWIVGKAAKVYRFREHLMWMFDGDDQYYTSTTRLYLSYTNEACSKVNLFNKTRALRAESEISALKTAMTIGYLLNRTVILPRFCIGPRALQGPLNSLIHIKTFESEFSGKYRENSFLLHPKVSRDVKSGLSKHQVVNVTAADTLTSPHGNVTFSHFDILRQFGDIKVRLLMIDSLRGVNVVLGNTNKDVAFNEKLRRAFYHSDYRQLKRW